MIVSSKSPFPILPVGIGKKIYLFTEDLYYAIDLYILESERDGDFHKQFEGLIKSIKVLQ